MAETEAGLKLKFSADLSDVRADLDRLEKQPRSVPFAGAGRGGSPSGQSSIFSGTAAANAAESSSQGLQQRIIESQNSQSRLSRMADGPAGAEIAGAVAGSGGARWGALTRRFAAGYAGVQALQYAKAGQQLSADAILAGSNQTELAQSQLKFTSAIGGSFFGLPDLITNAPESRALTQRTLRDAQEQDARTSVIAGGARFLRRFADSSNIATAGSDYERSGRQVSADAFDRVQNITDERQKELDAAAASYANARAKLNINPGTGIEVDSTAADLTLGRQHSIEVAAINRRYGGAFRQAGEQEFSAGATRAAERRYDLGNIALSGKTASLRGSQRDDAAALLSLSGRNQLDLDKMEGGRTATLGALGLSSFGGIAGASGIAPPDVQRIKAQTDANAAEEDALQRQISRTNQNRYRQTGAETSANFARARNDPITAALTELQASNAADVSNAQLTEKPQVFLKGISKIFDFLGTTGRQISRETEDIQASARAAGLSATGDEFGAQRSSIRDRASIQRRYLPNNPLYDGQRQAITDEETAQLAGVDRQAGLRMQGLQNQTTLTSFQAQGKPGAARAFGIGAGGNLESDANGDPMQQLEILMRTLNQEETYKREILHQGSAGEASSGTLGPGFTNSPNDESTADVVKAIDAQTDALQSKISDLIDAITQD